MIAKHFHGRTPIDFENLFAFSKESHRQPDVRSFLLASLGNLFSLPRATTGIDLVIRYSCFQTAFGNIGPRENSGS